MWGNLASVREVVDLSPQEALDSARNFLVGRGYNVTHRTASTLIVERQDFNNTAEYLGDLTLVVMAVPQSEGGVWIQVSGNDREGVRERQAEWLEWSESLPKRKLQQTRMESMHAPAPAAATQQSTPTPQQPRSDDSESSHGAGTEDESKRPARSRAIRWGVRWSGLAGTLGGALWLVTFLIGILSLSTLGVFIVRYAYLICVSLLLVLIELVGFYAALWMDSKRAGKTRFVLVLIRLTEFIGFISALVGLLIIFFTGLPGVAETFPEEEMTELWSSLLVVGIALFVPGMMLLGIGTITMKALSRWNGLPLVIGMLGALSIILLLPYMLGSPTSELRKNITFGAIATLGVGWIALGYVLWSAPFDWVERRMERLSNWISRLAFLDVLEYVGKLAILVVVVYWLVQIPDRNRLEHYEAWRVIVAAQGQEGTGGRIDALQDLYLDGETLVGLSADDAYLEGLNLYRPDVGEADLDSAYLQEADLSGANLHEASLWNADLRGASLGVGYDDRRTDLGGAELEQADLREADLTDADLTDADFFEEVGANLDRVLLNDAELVGADLRKATLEDASLQNAKLMRVDLRGANLETANLQGANLQKAKLSDAEFWHANIRGADLRQTDVTQEQLEDAYGDSTTDLPNNWQEPSEWDELTGTLVGGSRKPGDYSTGIFSPTLSFELVRDGWRVSGEESEDLVSLARDGFDPQVNFINVAEIYDPQHPYDPQNPSEPNTSVAPEDLVGWFEKHPHMEIVDGPERISVGGLVGTRLDILVPSAPEDYPEECRGPCVPVVRGNYGGRTWLEEGDLGRYYVLNAGYEMVVISINSLEAEDLREAEEVLKTVRLTNFDLATGQTLSGVFEPALSFTVNSEGWELERTPIRDWFEIRHEDALLNFINVAEVYDPQHPSDSEGDFTISVAPEDLVGWFEKHPRLKMEGKPNQVTVGGVRGVQLEVSVSEPAEGFCDICVPLFPTSDGDYYWLEKGYRTQLTILQVGGETVVISAESPTDQFRDFQEKAKQVIDSVKWRD